MQKIVYEDYLPKVLGEDAMIMAKIVPQDGGDRTRYLRKFDPSILNEFATAAYR